MDTLFVTQQYEPKVVAARWLYIAPPIAAMPVSFLATREILERMTGRKGYETYVAASVVPSAIYGIFSKFNLKTKRVPIFNFRIVQESRIGREAR